MCGRITLTSAPEIVADVFGLSSVPLFRPRYNIAPSQAIAVVRMQGSPPQPCLDSCRWGLVPSWAKDPAIGNRMINARAETVTEKPAYRSAVRARRCLVVADGFYEWRALNRMKQPYFVRRKDGRPFGIAGLWESWRAPDGSELRTCTVITTAANLLMAPIHDRMPVLVPRDAHTSWLDPHTSVDVLLRMLVPCADAELEAFAVTPHVNKPSNDDPLCIAPAAHEVEA